MPSQNDKHNLILTDFPATDSWAVKRRLEHDTGMAFEVRWIEGRIKVHRLRRMMNYFLFPLKPFVQRRRLDVLITWQQFFGIVFAWLCLLFHVKKSVKLIIMTFIYRPKRGPAGRLYEWWVKRAVCSRYVDTVVVFSDTEIDYYHHRLGIARDKLQFIPLSLAEAPAGDDRPSPLPGERYIFATGKSNRDYDFLIAALNGTDYRVVIASDTCPQPESQNITVRHDVWDDEMLHFMRHCHCVVIPLKNLDISSGQLVLLQAMQLGKPVVITRSRAIACYVQEGVNAIAIDNTPQELLAALHTLFHDPVAYRRLAGASIATFKRRHSQAAMGSALARVVAGQ